MSKLSCRRKTTKSKKHKDRYGLSLTFDNSRTGKKSQFMIRITDPTLRIILDEEKSNDLA